MKRLTIAVLGGILVLTVAAAWLWRGGDDAPETEKVAAGPIGRAAPLAHIETEAAQPGVAVPPTSPTERRLPPLAKSVHDPSKRVRAPPEYALAERSLEARLLDGVERGSTPPSEQPTAEQWDLEAYHDPEWFGENP